MHERVHVRLARRDREMKHLRAARVSGIYSTKPMCVNQCACRSFTPKGETGLNLQNSSTWHTSGIQYKSLDIILLRRSIKMPRTALWVLSSGGDASVQVTVAKTHPSQFKRAAIGGSPYLLYKVCGEREKQQPGSDGWDIWELAFDMT